MPTFHSIAGTCKITLMRKASLAQRVSSAARTGEPFNG
jgi:hypothetical protein